MFFFKKEECTREAQIIADIETLENSLNRVAGNATLLEELHKELQELILINTELILMTHFIIVSRL